jgi:hypothetical protein
LTSATDTKSLIEQAIASFVAEVPSLEPLKLIAAIELQGRGDVQMYRIEVPGPKVTKDIASDARVRLLVQRSEFNKLAAAENAIQAWRAAFETGHAKAEGSEQFKRLILQVVEKQEERSRTRRAKH